MPNRIIKESICESKKLSEVSFFAEDLYKRLITYADDYGRFNADYQIMLARLYPREIQEVSIADIEDALIELTGIGKIRFYTAKVKKEIYGCFPNWNEHQRVRDSKGRCPEPDNEEVNDWYLRRFIPRALRIRIIERDGFKCKECGKFVCAQPTTAERLLKMGAGLYHIDHIVPVVQGGRASEENLRLLCPKCNLSRKKEFTFDEILAQTRADLPPVAADCRKSPPESNPIQSESESISESVSETNHTAPAARDGRSEAPDYDAIVSLFNSICRGLPGIRDLTDKRKKAIRAADPRVEEYGGWEKLFKAIQHSDFLTGRSGAWTNCGFDWILKPGNLTKIMEGNYRNKDEASGQPPPSYDIEEMERRLWESPIWPNKET